MKYLINICFLICLACFFGSSQAQLLKVNGFSRVNTVLNIEGGTPFWFSANNSGRTCNSPISEQSWINSFQMPVSFGNDFSISTGLEAVVRETMGESFVNQLYLNLKYRSLTLKLGKEAFPLAQYNNEIGSGSLFLSTNARPIPRIGFGYYDYTRAPLLQGILVFKGAVQFGCLNDERGKRGTRKPWLQEKFFYLKTDFHKLNVWVGMNHSVLIGGTYPDGRKIPVDIFASFLGSGSSKFQNNFDGEVANAAGAHFGLFDAGIELKKEDWHLDIYYQKPIADGSGLRGIFNWKHDKVLGLNIVLDRKKLINQLVVEYIKTDFQSGSGTPDYVYKEKIPEYENIEACITFLKDNFDLDVDHLTADEYRTYLNKFLNNGKSIGGRDNYYNNGLYFRGNSFHRRSLGTPLFYTQADVSKIDGLIVLPTEGFFINNRIKAIHIGFSGWIGKKVSYRLLETYSINHGTYAGLYGGSHLWNEQENYFFKEGKDQNYLMLELNYHLEVCPLFISVAFGNDSGEVIKSKGIQVSVTMKI